MNRTVQIIKKENTAEQIVMFPFGGGSGYSYMELIKSIQVPVEIIVINPPGRLFDKARPLETIDAMVEVYSSQLRPHLKPNCLFFGHSIGGLVSFETFKALQPENKIKRMVISNINPPHRAKDHVDLYSHMDRETLIQKSTDLGGMPQIFKSEPEMLDLFINGLKSDLKALEAYRPPPLKDAVNTNIKADILYSNGDYIVDLPGLKEWEHYLDCSRLIEFNGDHFYLFTESNRKKVAQILSDHIDQLRR